MNICMPYNLKIFILSKNIKYGARLKPLELEYLEYFHSDHFELLCEAHSEVPPLTSEQAVIITGYTGVLVGDFKAFHKDLERRLRRPIEVEEVYEIPNLSEYYREDYMKLLPLIIPELKANEESI